MPNASVQTLLRTVDWQKFIPEPAHKVLRLIQNCHSEAMGFHAYQCEDKSCNHLHIQYHSCRNRHCPHCGSFRAQEWMEDRLRELLPVKYFHVVFTLPQELKKLVYLNRKEVYSLFFDSSSHCILTLSKDPKHLGAMPSIKLIYYTILSIEDPFVVQSIVLIYSLRFLNFDLLFSRFQLNNLYCCLLLILCKYHQIP